MNYQLIGDAMQTLLVNMQPGESVRAEVGALLFCNDAVTFDARRHSGLAGGVEQNATGGALAANSVAGHSVAYTTFSCVAPGGTVAFAQPYPGKIHPLELNGEAWLCQRDCLLCVSEGVEVETHLSRKFGSGLFINEGFTLLRLSGSGTAWIHLGGNEVETAIVAGRVMSVDAACLGLCQESVTVDLRFDGGFRNALFGGEGIFIASLGGMGTAFLQTMPLARLAGRIAAVSGDSSPAPIGAIGRIGNVLHE